MSGRNNRTTHPNPQLVKREQEGRESKMRKGIENGDMTGTHEDWDCVINVECQ